MRYLIVKTDHGMEQIPIDKVDRIEGCVAYNSKMIFGFRTTSEVNGTRIIHSLGETVTAHPIEVREIP